MIFESLTEQPGDPLLSLIGMYRDDPRNDKIDLGVGVYYDAHGATPVFRAVKLAERHLLETQDSKSYLGPAGNLGFVEEVRKLVFGGAGLKDRIIGMQTPGGTGAVRLAIETLKRSGIKRVMLGTPSWPVHQTIITSLGLEIVEHPWLDRATQQVRFDEMMAVVKAAGPEDAILIHGCCHNPTGADLTRARWDELTEVVAANGVTPLIDLAYHGLGHGLEEDAAGMLAMLARVPEALIAYSCDKNFGLYRDRVGALFTLLHTPADHAKVESNQFVLARAMWSMPPDWGGSVVQTILADPALTQIWKAELEGMCARMREVRATLAAAGQIGSVDLTAVGNQNGLFSVLDLSPDQVKQLREDNAVYMAGSGRINVAGLTSPQIPLFLDALRALG